jgi:hypothetical protein
VCPIFAFFFALWAAGAEAKTEESIILLLARNGHAHEMHAYGVYAHQVHAH